MLQIFIEVDEHRKIFTTEISCMHTWQRHSISSRLEVASKSTKVFTASEATMNLKY